MKTSYKNFIILLVAVLSFSACSDWLEVQPEGKIVLSEYWKNETDVESTVAACYRQMLNSDFASRLIVWGELRSDNLTGSYSIAENERKINELNIVPNNGMTTWASFYTLINYCNTVNFYAPKVIDPNFTQAEVHAKQAEVLTLRALAYFYLVRVFRDVPLILEPSISDVQDYNAEQSTEDEILNQIEKDLLQAESWAMSSYGKVAYNKGRVTKNTVRALLADIYLWRNKYEQSLTYCDKIISDPAFKLIEADDKPYLSIFGLKNSTESIFELQFSETNKVFNWPVFYYFGNNEDASGQFCSPDFIGKDNLVYVNTPVTTDVRRKDYIKPKDQKNIYNIFKYTGLLRSESPDGLNSTYIYRNMASQTPNWIFYRLSDIMLMKAEALVQLNRQQSDMNLALHMVNKIFMRSNPTLNDTLKPDAYPTKRDMEELVLLERQRELMFEGKRWFDLMRVVRREGRTDRLVEKVIRKYSENQSVISSKLKDMNALYLPINEQEMKANPKLKQNPYYITDKYK